MVRAPLLLLVAILGGQLFLCVLAANDVLGLSSSLTPASSPLRSSPSAAFLFSFRPASPSNSTSPSLYLAISFSASPGGHPAWVANRKTPVSASATLNLSSSGNLLLYDPATSSAPIWSSKTSGKGVVRAQLLDSGNLVLLNSSSGYIWQSFQYPTDTLLPGQPFTLASQLISNKRTNDFSEGRFSLTFQRTGVLQLIYTQHRQSDARGYSQAYWNWPRSRAQSVLAQFDQLGNIFLYNFPSSIISTYISNDHGTSATRRLTLDMDGNLRMYSWDAVSAQWNSVWMAFTDVCRRVRKLCGDYGVCIYTPQPTCICPPGFSTVDPTDLSGGCRPNHIIDNCSNKYVEIADTDFPYNDYYDFTFSSEEECKQACSDRCSCRVAIYWQGGDGHCWLKEVAQNGYSPGTQQHHAFLKISESDPYVYSPVVGTDTKWSSDTLWRPPSANQTGSSPSI